MLCMTHVINLHTVIRTVKSVLISIRACLKLKLNLYLKIDVELNIAICMSDYRRSLEW
jgi:hypothetical protein